MTRSMSGTPRVATILLLGLALAACGPAATSSAPGSSGGTEATATPDAGGGGGGQTADGLCGVVTEAMAVAALGGPVGEPSGGDVVPRPNGIYCRHSLAADEKVHVEAQLKEMTRADFDAQATAAGMDQVLDAVGEAAFQRPSGMVGLPGTTIYAFGGGRQVTVVITSEGDADAQLAAAIVIAEAALGS